MRIGILTFHRALNYGAVLQCYALCEVLKGMGHDVEIIDYRPTCIEKERWTFYGKTFIKKPLGEKVKSLLLIPFRFFSKHKASKVFDAFMSKQFCYSNRVQTPEDIPTDYDAIVFGSDQIWSPIICEEFNPIYYGCFAKGKTRFVCYAASLEGYKDFQTSEWDLIANRMKNFDAISVRELSFQKELSKHINRTVEWVVDPTLLISPTVFEKMALKPAFKHYVFLFTVQGGDLPYQVAKKIAVERSTIIVRTRTSGRMNIAHRELGVINVDSVSPEMFIGLIRHAECIVTNSFHATAISLQLRKNFYAVECQHPNRITDILKSLNLSSRYLTDANAISENEKIIDYDAVHENLKRCVKKSYDYLLKNLQNE